MITIDFLIVGQGLAGSLLAWELLQRGYRVVIIDEGNDNASKMAAGLINPITGLRFVKTHDVDRLLPAAKQRYAELSVFFQQIFYVEKTMLRIFRQQTERQQAVRRLNSVDYQAYLKPSHNQKVLSAINAPFGFIEQQQTGYLLTRPLLDCLKAFFVANNAYHCNKINYQDIQFRPQLNWQQFYPKMIIFCEGYQAKQNPWFSWLPWQLVQGEILTLQHKMLLPDNILNYGHWLVPLSKHQIRVGATFERDNLTLQPTQQAKNSLLQGLKSVIDVGNNLAVAEHHAQIRPCTLDKQPFIGLHPQHTQLAIFNGFGAKGSLQIPLYSQLFADALLHQMPYPSSINRYYASHFSC